MKNYYEILEINEKASQEIIEKVYKVLVKKYHPDLQENAEAKKKCEEKIKEINEAYEILSNEQARKEYDAKLAQIKLEYERSHQHNTGNNNTTYNNNGNNQNYTESKRYTRVYNQTSQNTNYNNQDINNNSSTSNQTYYKTQEELERERKYQQDYENAINKAYHDAYIRDVKNRGYKIKYKKTPKDYLRSLTALLITIGIMIIVFNLPFVKDYFRELYNTNDAFKTIIDFFGNIFK